MLGRGIQTGCRSMMRKQYAGPDTMDRGDAGSSSRRPLTCMYIVQSRASEGSACMMSAPDA